MDGPLAWFNSLPPITRTWLGLSAGITALITVDFLHPRDLIFNWFRIRHQLELWRVLTSFCYCGGDLLQFHTLILLYLIHNHAKSYERSPFPTGGGRTADTAFAFLFCIITILVSFPLINEYGPRFGLHAPVLYPLFTQSLVYAILYLWSRRNPNARVRLNFIPLQGKYLPFAYVGFSLFLGNRLNEMVHGLLVGHVFYYLVDIVPTLTGHRILVTPRFIVDVLGGGGIVQGNVADNDEPPPPQDDGATDAHIAAKTGNLRALRLLAQTVEGRQSMNAADSNSWTPLHEAVRGGHDHVVSYLIGQGVDVNARTQQGRGFSPLWLAMDTHGPNHEVSNKLREIGAQEIGPE